jgi:hypothetical protein
MDSIFSHSRLALVAGATLALLAIACGSGNTGNTGGGGTTAAGGAGSGGSAPAWVYGNPQDEEAYCQLWSEAQAMGTGCAPDPQVQASLLGSCAKRLPCYREVFEPDFMQKQRACLEDRVACTAPASVDCEEQAGQSYAAGAQLRMACEARSGECSSMGQNFDISCSIAGALQASARQAIATCFTQSTACVDADSCVGAQLGGACAAL